MSNFVDFSRFYIEYNKELSKKGNVNSSKTGRDKKRLKPNLESAHQS